MSVRGRNGPSWKIIKRLLRKKEQIFSKTVSVAASGVITSFVFVLVIEISFIWKTLL